jgi:hypothetical protein
VEAAARVASVASIAEVVLIVLLMVDGVGYRAFQNPLAVTSRESHWKVPREEPRAAAGLLRIAQSRRMTPLGRSSDAYDVSTRRAARCRSEQLEMLLTLICGGGTPNVV